MTRQEIEYVAQLAMLDTDGKGFDKLADDVNRILGFLEPVKEMSVDASAVVPDTEHCNVFRADVAEQLYSREEMLENAPTSNLGGFFVPRVME